MNIKNLTKKDFEKAKNIFEENREELLKKLDFIWENEFISEKLDSSIKIVLKTYKKDEEKEFLETFWNLDLKDFDKEYFYKIKEYRFLRREYSEDIIFRIYTEIFSKKDNLYKISYNLDFNSDFEIIDDWLYL